MTCVVSEAANVDAAKDFEGAMKVRASVKRMCDKCKIVRRRGVVRVLVGDRVRIELSNDVTRGRIVEKM